MDHSDTPRDERAGILGYGNCSASGCYCQSYSGSADTCANCGHNFATHY
jgi:hypothetical protein